MTASTDTTVQVEMFDTHRVSASGIMIRGKRITDDWQVHRVGCRDGRDLKRIFGRYDANLVSATGTLDAVRDAFNADMGPGGAAGFTEDEGGWDFDRDVRVKPCTSR